MNYYKYILVVSSTIIILTAVAVFYIFSGSNSIGKNLKKLSVGNSLINVEIADNSMSRYEGLSNREKICGQCGMLFVFPDKKNRTFVMREMMFPLDIIWINDKKIVKIDKYLAPEGKNVNNYYNSPGPLNYVLEVNAGFADKTVLREGDDVYLP